jgi:hypothetical protein
MRNLSELIEPQFGKKKPQSQPQASKSSESPSDLDRDGNVDSFEKKVRQLIYDVRHLMKAQNLPLQSAFSQRVAKTNYPAEVVKAAKEKMGIKTSVAEANIYEADGQNMISVVIRYNNGTTDRRSVTRGEIQRLRSQPNVSSVELTKYGVSRRDYDGDGKIESGKDEHAGAVHNAIQRRTGGVADGNPPTKRITKKKMKSYGVSEGYSNWREELFEIADDGLSSDSENIVKEKKVNNYVGKKPVVEISPTLGMQESVEGLGGELLEMEDISEDYLIEELYSNEIAIATQYFCEQGLNEYGIDILIEKLGVDEFCDYVEDIAENYCLVEARRSGKIEVLTKDGKPFAKKGKPSEASLKRLRGLKQQRKDAEEAASNNKPSGMTAALKSQSDKARRVATKTAVAKQPESEKKPKETKDGVKKGIFGALKQSWNTAREVGRGHEQKVARAAGTVAGAVAGAAKAVHTAGQKAGESETGKKIKSTLAKAGNAAAGGANDAIDARSSGKSAAATAGRALGGFVRRMRAEELELLEKAPPGAEYERMVKHIKKGYSEDGLTKKERQIAYATAWKKYNKKMEEAVDPNSKTEPKQDSKSTILQNKVDQQQKKDQTLRTAILVAKTRANRGGVDVMASYEPTGNVIDEDNFGLGLKLKGIEYNPNKPQKTRALAKKVKDKQWYDKNSTLQKQKATGDTGLHKGKSRPGDDENDYDNRDHPSLSARERNPSLGRR